MMRPTTTICALCLLLFTAMACTPPDTGEGEGEGEGEAPPQCEGASYLAFDVANYENQVLRVGAHASMIDAMKAAEADIGAAGAKYTEAEELYLNTAELAAKVAGRNDDHLAAKPNVGAELDETIRAGLSAGKAATAVLEASLARQAVDKTLTDFFFLSVHHEMLLGAKDKWDEAFGYFGADVDNAEASLKGLAAVAKKRDDGNGTTLREDIFNGLVDGSCELARALAAEGTEAVVVGEHAELKAIVDEVDLAMQQVLAFSAGHEALEMIEVQADLAVDATDRDAIDEMYVKLAELEPYFRPIERIMNEKGGASATRAARIRAEIDAAFADDTAGWTTSFDAQGVLDEIEAEYGIEVVD